MISRFLDYVEIKTKITSLFAFLMTFAYLFYVDVQINILASIVFFLSMFIFDLTTTAINNYIDTKTNDQVLQFKRGTSLTIILVMFFVSALLGLYLAWITDVVVLLVGGLCFLCGVFYTYGPVPISRQPLGEVFSGFFYGVLIPFLLLYINMPNGHFVSLNLTWQRILLEINTFPMLTLLLLSVIPFATTANIMLANNICDVEKDVAVGRFTLAFFLKERALLLFALLYYSTYVAVIVMVVLKILSPISLLALLTIIPVQRNLNIFSKKQEKSVTFITAIKNYVVIMGSNTALIFVAGIL